MVNFNTDKIILLRFPQFAGGNFICNCLGLSKHTMLKHRKHAQYLYDNPTDYDYRLNAVMSTLPTVDNDKTELKDWQTRYEWNDARLYPSVDLDNWHQTGIASCHDEFIAKLSNSNFDFFVLQHSYRMVENALKVWPNGRILQLINFEKFWNIAAPQKDPMWKYNLQKLDQSAPLQRLAGNEHQKKYNELSGHLWPSWQEFQQVGYNIDKISGVSGDIRKEIKQFYDWHNITATMMLFDIDNSIFEKSAFLTAMQDLYLKLKYDDFESTRISKFWQAYMELHVDKLL
jgi:Fe-S cluster biosynthesis and repair protein YggX